MKITFTMTPHTEQPKHSTRFNLDAIETPQEAWMKDFRPSFYIPKPFAQNAKRIRVTIETLE